MNIDTGLLDITLKKEAEGYFTALAEVLSKFHRAPPHSISEPEFSRELRAEGDFVVSILFIGTIFGEYSLAISAADAHRLFRPMLADTGMGLEESDLENMLGEALNLAAGSRVQPLAQAFQRITITAPRVARGSIRHSAVRAATCELRFPGVTLRAGVFLDKMRLEIAESYREGIQRLEAANRSLTEAHESLKRQQAQLVQSEKMASLGIMAAGVAHEINNPLAFVSSNFESLLSYLRTIRGLVEGSQALLAALEGKDSEAAKSALATVKQIEREEDISFILEDTSALTRESLAGLERIRGIVNGLKRFSRVDEADRKKVLLNEEIANALQLLNNELKYRCTVELEAGAIPEVECNPGELGQVLVNLLINAAQSMPEKGGHIRIGTQVEGGSVKIRICDNGCGIPKENLEKLFTPFFTTKPVGQGTGLGLAISHGIIEKHGGTIQVESEVGQGTTFTISLPALGRVA